MPTAGVVQRRGRSLPHGPHPRRGHRVAAGRIEAAAVVVAAVVAGDDSVR